jgi:tRNA-specific 2-thiouridylase
MLHTRFFSQLINLKIFTPKTSPQHGHVANQRLGAFADINRSVEQFLSSAKHIKIQQPLEYPTFLANDAIVCPPVESWPNHPELLAGCHPSSSSSTTPTPLRVAALFSGGVDSSLALQLLHAAGHQVTAFYLQIWFQEDFRNFWDACPWEEDLRYCKQVCDKLGIDLQVVPLTDAYWDRVVAHSVEEIKAGRTPNPDMMCNSKVKFGAFCEWLDETYPQTYDRIASGHYARIEEEEIEDIDEEEDAEATKMSPTKRRRKRVRLALTPDTVKDQTYFLACLSPTQLSKALFPLGTFTKPQVRALAAAASLPTQSRADSQGICFLGKVKFEEFIAAHLGEWPGPIIEEESNEVLGYHRGQWFHTPGQRKGLRLPGGPWYVTRKDPRLNIVWVSRQYYDEEGVAARQRSGFTCGPIAWVSDLRLSSQQQQEQLGGGKEGEKEEELYCKVRHGPNMHKCTVTTIADNNGGGGYRVQLEEVDQGLAAGQFAVFYQNGYCLGGAVITRS